MYLLISDTIAACIRKRVERGHPQGASYGTFWGASEGLAFFKRPTGFHPFRTYWQW